MACRVYSVKWLSRQSSIPPALPAIVCRWVPMWVMRNGPTRRNVMPSHCGDLLALLTQVSLYMGLVMSTVTSLPCVPPCDQPLMSLLQSHYVYRLIEVRMESRDNPRTSSRIANMLADDLVTQWASLSAAMWLTQFFRNISTPASKLKSQNESNSVWTGVQRDIVVRA